MKTLWRIELLGGLRAVRGNSAISRFRTQQTGGLLACLAFYSHRAHPREELIERLWPEVDPEAGRNNLRVALSSLRHQLEPPGVPARTVITADRHLVQLSPAAATTDVAEFEAALHRAQQARREGERLDRLQEAVALYRGELLPGHFEEWILPERLRLTEAFLETLGQLVHLLEAAGDLASALHYALRSVCVDPVSEEAHEEVVRLLAATGQPTATLRQYQELQRVVEATYGVAPAAALQSFAASLWEKIDARPERRHLRVPSIQSSSDLPLTTGPGKILPTGTITLLLTELEGFAAPAELAGHGWAPHPGRAAGPSHESTVSAPSICHDLLRQEFRRYGGVEVREVSDSSVVAFQHAIDAVSAAVAGQRALASHRWPVELERPQARMALHSGDVDLSNGQYDGPVFVHAVRLLRAAHAGQILLSGTTASLLEDDPPSGLHLQDLGWHQLGEAAPERLFQACGAEMGHARFPPPRASSTRASNLPIQLTRFFGREEEMAQLIELLMRKQDGSSLQGSQRPAHEASHGSTASSGGREQGKARSTAGPERQRGRLVVLTGPAGCGKTRLALEVTRRLQAQWRGAIWLVSLADLAASPAPDRADSFGGKLSPSTSADRIPDRIHAALGLPRTPGSQPFEQVVAFLSRQSSLLLLDNLEHLVSEGASLVQALLERVESLTILATSRQRLHLPGEREFPVEPLLVPALPEDGGHAPLRSGQAGDSAGSLQSTGAPEMLLDCASVRLFVDRAQAARPDFQITQANAKSVAALCTRLEGLPLAIELAAARAGSLTPQQMLARLELRFELLATRQPGLDPRHRSLRAALDWSYRLLSPELQRFFAQLSVFRGGWTLEAAAMVCEEPRALEYLEHLRASSLVSVREGAGDELRYGLLQTLQEYGAEQLAPAEQSEVARWHATYYLTLAERAELELGGAGPERWLARLEADNENLRAALAWALATGEAELGLRLAGALWRYWWVRGYGAEGWETVSALLALPEATEHPAARAKAQTCAGLLAHYQGDPEAGRSLQEAGLSACRERGDHRMMAPVLTDLGTQATDRGDFGTSRQLLEESVGLWRELGDAPGLVSSLNHLGRATRYQGDYQASHSALTESLAIGRALNDPSGVATALTNLGVLAREQGEFQKARPLLAEAAGIYRECRDPHRLTVALTWLGMVALQQDDPETARSAFEESLAIERALANKPGVALALNHLGELAIYAQDWKAARSWYEQELPLQRALNNKSGVAWTLYSLSRVAGHEGAAEEQSDLLRQSLQLWQEVGDQRGVAMALEALARAAAAQGQPQRAARLYGAAQSLRDATGNPLPPFQQPERGIELAALREALGDAAFAAAWEAGASLTREQAIPEALTPTTPARAR